MTSKWTRRLAAIGLAVMALAVVRPAAAQSILSEVIKRGTIRIATVAGNPPYSAISPSGEPVGYDIEIGKAIAAALKVKPEFTVVDTPGRITALQTHRVDITLANFTNTVERSTVIAFTSPYVVVGAIYMVKKDSPIQTVAQLNDAKYKIGVPRGGTSEVWAAQNCPNAQLVRFDTVNDAYLALKTGQVDAHLQDSFQNAAFIQKDAATMRNLPGNWSYEEIAIGLPAGDFDWWRVMETWVRQFNGSGDNARLFKKFFGFDLPAFN